MQGGHIADERVVFQPPEEQALRRKRHIWSRGSLHDARIDARNVHGGCAMGVRVELRKRLRLGALAMWETRWSDDAAWSGAGGLRANSETAAVLLEGDGIVRRRHRYTFYMCWILTFAHAFI